MNKHTILVVDDDPGNIDLLVSILKDRFTIKAARNGLIALKICRSATSPDLVLLDVLMPEMDGYEVCRQLKTEPLTQTIPVIFLSGKDDVDAAEYGAVCALTKPVDGDKLMTVINSVLTL